MNEEFDFDHIPGEPVQPRPEEHSAPVAEAPVFEAAPVAPVTPEQPMVAEPYRPEPYSDAGYVPSSAAPTTPKSYYCNPPVAEKKEKKAKKQRRGMHWAAVVALCLVCAILGGAASYGVTWFQSRRELPATEPGAPIPAPTAPVAEGPAQSELVINKVELPSGSGLVTLPVSPGAELTATEIYYDLALKQVVGITTEITYTNYFGYTSSGAVTGSGFLISADGYILTNHHVISDAVKGNYDVQVLTRDGTKYIATVVGYEEENDVAVLKIEGSDFPAATIGDSDAMRVGETVYAVGNPLGELEYTMTDGMVSALDREITTASSNGGSKTINMFQISAAINEGNSGGPVYNSRGEVIGISTAKYSDTGVEGLGFAIPINDAIKIAGDLITDGYVRGKASMGISVGTVNAAAAQYYGLVEGAIVSGVVEGSCAEKAGLKENDIIVALDDHEVKSQNDLITAKREYRAGDSAVLKVYRGGDYVELNIVFDEATPGAATAEDADTAKQPQNPADGGQQSQVPSYGGGNYRDFFDYFFGGFPFN